MPKSEFFSGLDLGQQQDYSALVIVEQLPSSDGISHSYAVRHLHRWPLGTSYPTIVEHLDKMYSASAALVDTMLIIDATGVGRPVVDMVTAAKIMAVMKPMSITAGMKPGAGTVPKKDLVGAVQTALQTRRLKIASGLPLADTLAKELEMFRVKVTADRNETFASWRERDHDDLVLALALAVWYGEKHPGNSADCFSRPEPYQPGIDPLTGLPASIWGPVRRY
jgi:hypothetical protein